jgi:tRNA pseudouridine55 synthase
VTGSTAIGILAVDKPVGPTSHDVVALARRALKTKKVGHTGTLDPFASGLMLLCVGAATRLSPYLTHLDKRYRAEAVLGVATDTLDREGAVVREDPAGATVATARIEEALAALRGTIEQIPPVYSAKKIRGEAAHRRARRGEAVELKPVEVHVHRLDLLERDGPHLVLDVECSSGTYIRALARDLGEALGVGAHLTALRRPSVGSFQVDDASTVDAMSSAPAAAWSAPAEALVRAGVASFEVDSGDEQRIGQGREISAPADLGPGEVDPVAAVLRGQLLAVGRVAEGVFRPRRVFVSP